MAEMPVRAATWSPTCGYARVVDDVLAAPVDSPGLVVGRGDGRESGVFVGRLMVGLVPWCRPLSSA